MSKKRIGLLGFGTVGRGVYGIINEKSDVLDSEIKKVFDLPSRREQLGDLLVTDYKEITESDDIDTVIECLGGDELPYKAIVSALSNGKNVITSNKETIAKHIKEYRELSKENNCIIRFEASAGGGIPCIEPLNNISSFDDIKSFTGIMNGTTNYILTKMTKDGCSFEKALKDAQDLGFAERDPSADLMGLDLLRKAMIMCTMAFRRYVDFNTITYHGIENINETIIEKLKSTGHTLKFIIDAKKLDDDVCIEITPALLEEENVLNNVYYETNAIYADCKYNDRLTFIGKGAGMVPTAAAIIQDLENINRGVNYSYTQMRDSVVLFESGNKYIVFNKEYNMTEKTIMNSEELKEYVFAAKKRY